MWESEKKAFTKESKSAWIRICFLVQDQVCHLLQNLKKKKKDIFRLKKLEIKLNVSISEKTIRRTSYKKLNVGIE